MSSDVSSDLSSEPAPQGYRRVGDSRFREIVGFGYSELRVGTVIEHRPGRTVTETDNVLMSTLTGNAAPIHLDAHYSSKTEWGQPLVCSIVTLGIVAGMTVRSTSGLTIANLALSDMTFDHPVFVGDTLYAETQIMGRRLSQSRPQNGIVSSRTAGFNQHGQQVITFARKFLVPSDPEATRAATDY